MRIDVELSEDEAALLSLMLRAGMRSMHISVEKIDSMFAVVNKVMKDNPNYTPYDLSRQKIDS